MSFISVLWTPDWHQTLFECIKGAKEEVFLVSPWLKLAGAELILNALRENYSTPIVNKLTTFNESELIGAKSSSDLKAYCLLLGYGVEVRVVQGLHAKIYICDRHHTVVSSGNLTGPGLGLSSHCNFEIALHISDPNTAQQILEQILEIWQTSEILTLELLRKNVERIQITNTDYIKSVQETYSNEKNHQKLETHGYWWSGNSSENLSSYRPIKFNFNIEELSNLIGTKSNFQETLNVCDAIQKQFKPKKKQDIVSGSELTKGKEKTSGTFSNKLSSVLSEENSLVSHSGGRDVELKSAKGVDYRKLQDLLANQNFKEANEETWWVMCQVAELKGLGEWLRAKDINNFPCQDLRTIDQLWLKHSKGHFGFSIQKQIYQELGGTKKYVADIWKTFYDRVGWLWETEGYWLYYNRLKLSWSRGYRGKISPRGHLPLFPPPNSWADSGPGGGIWINGASIKEAQRQRSLIRAITQKLITCGI